MHITRPTLLKIGGYITLSLLIGEVIIFMDAWDTAKTERQREAQTDVTYRDTVDGVDWYTYTNRIYGYAISYPGNVTLLRSSELNTFDSVPGHENDVIVSLKDAKNDSIYTIGIGVNLNVTANNIEELRTFYNDMAIPQMITDNLAIGRELQVSDFIVRETVLNSRPVLEVIHPYRYSVTSYNESGIVFILSGSGYTGATTTPKEQLTREIMETFRVLD
jgi:hypothetical protein